MPQKRKSDPAEPSLRAKILGNVKEIDGQFVCDVQPECRYSQTTLVPHNFARHIGALHPETYNLLELGEPIPVEEVLRRTSKTPTKNTQTSDESSMVRIYKQRLLGGIVKMVTVHHQPYNILNWEGLRDIIDPPLDAFGIKLNNKNISEYVSRVRAEIDIIISSEVKNQMISIKFDTTTKRYRCVLGINAQFYKGTTLVKRTLGMVELHDRHTAVNLKNKIEEVYSKFGIRPGQIYTATVDNARNVCAAVKELQAVQRDERKEQIEEYAEQMEKDMDDDEIASKIEEINDLLSNLEVTCIRCGAHTLNLVATDNTSKSSVKETSGTIAQIVDIVKMYRKAEFKEAFNLNQQKFPPIPNATRWHVNYELMETLEKGRPFFDRLAVNAPDIDLSEHWKFIEEYCEAFKPLHDSSIKVQKLFCPLSQFYLEWLLIQGQITQLPDTNRFKEGILKSMTDRERTIFRNNAYRGSIFMDPRFIYNGSKLFSPNEREDIIVYLISIWKMVNGINNKSEHVQEVVVQNKESKSSSSRSFDMDQYISTMFGEASASTQTPTDSIEQALRDIQYQKRQSASDASFNIIEYWFKQKIRDPRLWEIARVVYSAASTQVSVERDNSHFGLIFTPQRHLLGEENLENILQVRLNEPLIAPAISAAFASKSKTN